MNFVLELMETTLVNSLKIASAHGSQARGTCTASFQHMTGMRQNFQDSRVSQPHVFCLKKAASCCDAAGWQMLMW